MGTRTVRSQLCTKYPPLSLARCARETMARLLAAALLALAPSGALAMPLAAKNASLASELVRIVVGGSLSSDSPILEFYRGFPPLGVKYITAAGTNPVADGIAIGAFFAAAGIDAEWIPVHDVNCDERTRDPVYVRMVEEADAIYMSGGQAGRVQSCLFGNYAQSGTDEGEVTPFLAALQAKAIVGGSSAGAMNQPISEILITGHSAESYSAVRAGSVFLRGTGNGFLSPREELVDVHFSERGRQGRLMVLAMETDQAWAFGADENTAYVFRADGGDYEVVGEEGVVIYQATTGDASTQRALMHFLTAGDRINPLTGVITWAADKVPCALLPTPAPSNSIFSVRFPWFSLILSCFLPQVYYTFTLVLPQCCFAFASSFSPSRVSTTVTSRSKSHVRKWARRSVSMKSTIFI